MQFQAQFSIAPVASKSKWVFNKALAIFPVAFPSPASLSVYMYVQYISKRRRQMDADV